MREWFLRFRRSNAFLVLLCFGIVLWLIVKFIWRFDNGNGWANLILSIEASVATALLLDLSVRQQDTIEELLRQILSEEKCIEDKVEKGPEK